MKGERGRCQSQGCWTVAKEEAAPEEREVNEEKKGRFKLFDLLVASYPVSEGEEEGGRKEEASQLTTRNVTCPSCSFCTELLSVEYSLMMRGTSFRCQ